MKIEEIEELENIWYNASASFDVYSLLEQALDALRSEAWHPIEKAEELGAKDGRWVLLWNGIDFWDACWNEEWYGVTVSQPTHFRFINTP